MPHEYTETVSRVITMRGKEKRVGGEGGEGGREGWGGGKGGGEGKTAHIDIKKRKMHVDTHTHTHICTYEEMKKGGKRRRIKVAHD